MVDGSVDAKYLYDLVHCVRCILPCSSHLFWFSKLVIQSEEHQLVWKVVCRRPLFLIGFSFPGTEHQNALEFSGLAYQ